MDPYFASRAYLWRVQAVLLIEAVPASTLPLWWGAIEARRHYSPVDFAFAQTTSAVGALVASMFVAAVIARADRRLLLIGMLGLYALSLAGIALVTTPVAAALLWGAAFLSMTGVEAMGLAYLGYSPSAQRNNGVYVTVQTMMFGVAPLALPPLMAAVGVETVLVLFAAMLLGAGVLVAALPKRLPELQADAAAPRQGLSPRRWAAAGGAVAAYALFAWYTVTLFNFSEQFGQARRLDMMTIGLFLGVAGFIGVPGSLLAAYGGERLGRVLPVVGGTALFLLACGLLKFGGGGSAGYAAGLALSSFSWSLLMPYVLSIMARIDPYGRVLAVSYSVKGVAGVALAAGDAAAIARFGVGAVAWLCGACALGALAAYLVAETLADKAAEPA